MSSERTLRRGTRIKRKPQKFWDSTHNTESSDEMEDESDMEIDELPSKPSSALFEEEDVSGKSMFGFKKYKKRGSMAQRASGLVHTPQISKNRYRSTPERLSEEMPPKTPHSMRRKVKKEIQALAREDEDFSDSGSEFRPSGSESSTPSEEDPTSSEDSSAGSEEDEEPRLESKKGRPEIRSQRAGFSPETRLSPRKGKDQMYVVSSEDYFSWNASSKISTSNHTLQKLKKPKLSEEELQQLLASCSLSHQVSHQKPVQNLFKMHQSNFNRWFYILHEGFNLVLYGLGSKRDILRAFQKEMLNSQPVVVVNGYFPGLTIREVVDGILGEVFDEESCPSNVFEAVDLIKAKCEKLQRGHLYIIVHNIDGPTLRNNKSQNVLAALADIPNVHLLASIDHINTPLIWDHSKLSKFNFIWWDVTSFSPYTNETSFESSMLVQRSGALALSSLTNVYQSLTKNSKGVFLLIVKYQLDNKSTKHYQGMPFKVLYSQCRENFLVSSDLALRAQLTEFLDHKLMKNKRSIDGTELLFIPVHNSLLQQFLDQKP